MKKFLLLMITLVISVTAWAADPYFEVISGSFATKDAEVKVTFPGVTNVELKNSLAIYDGGNYITSIFEGDFNVSGNVISFTMNPSGYYINEPGDDPLTIELYFSSSYLSLDGESSTLSVYSKDWQPYSEVTDGSLGSGNVTVKVTVPRANAVNFYPTSYPQFYSVSLYHNGMAVTSLNIDSPSLTISGNTVSAVFSYSATGDDNLSKYYVYFDQYALQLDGRWNVNDVTAPFRGSAVDPDDPDEGGGEGGDDPDTDPEVPADLTNYFWVENLSEDATTLSFYGKNIEYTNTPNDASSWVRMDGQIDFEAHQKVYLRASAEGNTNMANAMSVGNFGDFYDGIEWTHIDTRVAHKVGGDITTLLNAQGNMTRLPAPFTNGEYYISGVFENFFYNDTYLQDVSELVLPSTTLTEYCYAGMFNGCTSITKAPVLPATVLVKGCYDKMFNECNSLNYVEAYFSEWPKKSTGYSPYAATENWLQNVAAEGTFKTHYWVGNDYKYYGSTYPAAWNKEELGSMDIPVSAVGYTTFYYEKNWVMPEGMEGYVAYETYNNETYSYDFVFEKAFEAGEIVPFAQPLILKAKAGTYTIHFTEEDATRHISDEFFNLNGSITTKNLASEYESYNYYYYALSLNASGENVGFYWMNDNGEGFTSAPFKAWLRISKTHFASGVKGSFAFGDFEDMTDGIKTAAVSQQKAKGVYDLSGRRVNGNAQRGMYIINGKKVIR